jgi:putative proteasome-type protease
VLKRSLSYENSLDYALKCAFLAFDATRICANDVDFPIDTVVLENNSYHTIEKRFEQKELEHISDFWNERLRNAINELPAETLTKAFEPNLLSISSE